MIKNSILMILMLLLLTAIGCSSKAVSVLVNESADDFRTNQFEQLPREDIRPAPAHIYNFSKVDNLLENNIDVFGGNVFLVVKQDDKLLHKFKSGFINWNTRLGIASATKWFSGAVILSLVDDGLISLDDRIGDYLPIFDEYNKGDITILQCFSMSSGLFSIENYETDRSLTLEESVNLIAQNVPMVYEPGTMMAYDGSGMQTVGRIAEIVCGTDWKTIAKERLFNKCDMPSADYDAFGLNPGISGGARTTPLEYLNFLQMIMNDGVYNDVVVLSPESVDIMFTNQTGDLPIYYSPFPYDVPYCPYYEKDLSYNFGAWQLAENPASLVVEEICSPGAWGTFPWADRKRGIYGIIFTWSFYGFLNAIETELHALHLIRTEMDGVGHLVPIDSVPYK